MFADSYRVSPGTIYAHTHYTCILKNIYIYVYIDIYIYKKGNDKVTFWGRGTKFLPGPDGTPIWASINLPPKTRAYKWFDILGNKLIAGR